MIRDVVENSGLRQEVIAEDAGLSYAGIRAWVLGHRVPRPESIAKLVKGLRARGRKLLVIADRLEGQATGRRRRLR